MNWITYHTAELYKDIETDKTYGAVWFEPTVDREYEYHVYNVERDLSGRWGTLKNTAASLEEAKLKVEALVALEGLL